jgi:hypothetical protein
LDSNIKILCVAKVHALACKESTVQPEQSGGRPGKSALDAATNTAITTEIVKLQRKTGITLYNDARACFDRIIENISNATLLSKGMHPKITTIHANT